jgi:protein SCO1/2
MKKLMIIALAGIALAGCKKYVHLSLPYFNTPDFTPVWVDKTDPAYRRLHTIPPFAFTDQNGQLITQNSTRGKIYVANFFFTRCGNICPKMMDNMKKVSAAFAGNPNVIIISHSVAPWYDDVSVLKKYAAEKDINNPNWHLVTGSKEQIYSIAGKVILQMRPQNRPSPLGFYIPKILFWLTGRGISAGCITGLLILRWII